MDSSRAIDRRAAVRGAGLSRILLYSHDSCGLGHLRRSLTLAGAIVRRDPGASVLCVTGLPRSDLFAQPERCELVRIPSVTKGAGGEYVSRGLPLPIGEVASLRSRITLGAVQGFRPDTVVVDHAPLGVQGELRPVLEWLRDRSPSTRRVLGLRDVIDEPELTRRQFEREGTAAALRDLFHEILVYGHREVFDVGEEYRLPRRVREKISYVGYVVPPTVEAGANGAPHPPRLLVCAGGGGDGAPLLHRAVEALTGPLRESGITARVVTGPFLPDEERRRLEAMAGAHPHVTVERDVEEMHRLMPAADLVLSMGGYNTIHEALATRTRALVWPRTSPRLEQLERARRLEAMGLVGVLSGEEMRSARKLAGRIREALRTERPDPAPLGLAFDGADRAAERLILQPHRRPGARVRGPVQEVRS